MDALELKVAENYVTKQEFREQFTELFRVLNRLEDKIDAHVGEDRARPLRQKTLRHLKYVATLTTLLLYINLFKSPI